MDNKIGIYLCSGCGIDKAIDFDGLKSVVKSDLKYQVLETNPQVCGEFADKLKADVAEKGLNKVIIGACSSRYFASRFDFGPDALVERVPLREFVAWSMDKEALDAKVQENGWDDESHPIMELAADYLRMAGAKVENAEAPQPVKEEVVKDVLVVGGGVAGMSAALTAAKAGYKVVLVEKEAALGGWAARFKWVFPSRPPFTKPQASPAAAMAEEVLTHPNVTVMLSSTVAKTSGQPGQYDVVVRSASGEQSLRIGSIVQATGWQPYDPNKLSDKYGYGRIPNVVTSVELEAMVKNGGIRRPSDGKAPRNVAIVHCAGSRDKEHLAYCSAVCCRAALKQALYVRDELPDANVYLLYKDVRSPGVFEQFYEAVQQEKGVFLTKGEVVKVDGSAAKITVSLDETLLGEPIDVEADLLVLATGIMPTAKLMTEKLPTEASGDEDKSEEAKAEAAKKKELGRPENVLNLTYMQGTDLPSLKYGFPDSHFICFPYETRRTGIYTAGMVRAPMDLMTARSDGAGAALKAIQVLECAERGVAVHPRAGDVSIPDFFLQRCTQCKRCTQECPFGTLDEDEKGTPKPNPLRCRRCGICMGACPERIISFKNYSPNMVSQMIKSIHIPEEDEERPRILAFVCENDALPALDLAALHRRSISPWIRVVPVRCIGSVNTVWIADALSNGFDGILLCGCQRGDDYQCHFIRGSELAKVRMKNVQEKLQQLVLEPERVRIEAMEISDWAGMADLFNEFAETIEGLGANPYKGF